MTSTTECKTRVLSGGSPDESGKPRAVIFEIDHLVQGELAEDQIRSRSSPVKAEGGHGAWLTPVVTRDSAFSGYGPRVAMFCKACEMILSRAGDIQRSDDRSWTMLEDAGMAHDTLALCAL